MNIFAKVFSPLVYVFYNKLYSKFDYFEYEKLTKWYFDVPQIGFRSMNMLYGNHKCAEKALGRKIDHWHVYLEHAVFFYGSLPSSHWSRLRTVITTSPFRKQLIEDHFNELNYTSEVVSIGAYIKYAENFHNKEKLNEIKSKYGRILLVMPSHSIDGIDVDYDKDEFQTKIDAIAKDFDTVFVCLYWRDVQRGAAAYYKNKGYIVVCNGMRSDSKFMSRQRDLIELADMCMSNTLGSYVGYSIVMNKPFYFVPQQLDVKASNTEHEGQTHQFKRSDSLNNEFAEAFGEYSFDITDKQKQLIDKYWGL